MTDVPDTTMTLAGDYADALDEIARSRGVPPAVALQQAVTECLEGVTGTATKVTVELFLGGFAPWIETMPAGVRPALWLYRRQADVSIDASAGLSTDDNLAALDHLIDTATRYRYLLAEHLGVPPDSGDEDTSVPDSGRPPTGVRKILSRLQRLNER